MGALMRAHDWTRTPFGPPQNWPQSLRSALSICLGSSFQVAIYWGPELALLYNDAWSEIPGQKHPWALGRPGREVWPEIWDTIGPLFDRVLRDGEATLSRDQLLAMDRRGFIEECYFDYTFSPIRDEAGSVGGIFNIAVETTFRVLGERRTRLLKDLGEQTTRARSAEEACRLATAAMATDAADLPFCLLYLRHGHELHLAGTAGLATDSPASAAVIDLHDKAAVWPAEQALASGKSASIEGLTQRWGLSFPGGPWPEPCDRALVVPLPQVGQGESPGVLVAGISPRLVLDTEYEAFVDRVAGLTATAVANARAYEEERKRAEALAELDRAKTTFFSNVSHEFRTPLTLMLGPVEDLLAKQEQDGNPEDRELLQVVHRSGLRLQRLVNTLLDFSRIEAGRAEASFEPTDLAAFTTELASSFRSAMDSAGLRYTVDCPPLTQPVYIDREMWEKVVLNLVSNAFKYTLEGAVSVRITERSGNAELSVADTGPGIPEEEIPRLFERFHRVKGTRGRTHEGTGIGLALVQELVKLHGGAVSVESKLGQGSTFTVSLPFGAEHLPQNRIGAGKSLASTSVHTDAYIQEAIRWLPQGAVTSEDVWREQPSSSAQARRSRVLLADDNADMRDYVRRLLSSHYDVTAVANGEEAWSAAQAHPPDLVLTDVMMPRMDGFELLAALRNNESTKTLPVLMLSARAGEESRLEGLSAGADDYLVKPFTARELLARVEAHLSLARMRREADQARRMSEMRLGLALEATGLLAWQWDPAKDEVQFSGDMSRIFGQGVRSAAERSRMVLPEDLEAHRTKVESAARHGASYHSELRIRRNDTGAIVWLEERATAIVDEEGRITIVGVTADVTARKAGEEALRESEERFRSFAEYSTDLLWIVDATTGQLEYLSRAFEEMWGEPAEAVLRDIGRWADLLHPEDRANAVKAMPRLLAGETLTQEYRIVRPVDGAVRWIRDTGFPIRDSSGAIRRVAGIAQDVTERVRAAAALKAEVEAQVEARKELERVNKELEEFAYVASHDLQEPLRMVGIYSQLLLQGFVSDDPAANEYAGFIKAGVKRMQVLIRDLLTYSRTVQRDETPFGVADLAAAVREAQAVLKARIDETGAIIHVDALPEVRGDTKQLAHVFQNLLSNALKYQKRETTPEVRISARQEGDKWVVCVQDNGIGFDPRYAEKIFGLFKRLHKDEYPGTGLGLAISRRLATLMEGNVECESRVGEGSTFTFTMTAAVEREPVTPPDLSGLRTRIAIIAASPVFRDQLTGPLAACRLPHTTPFASIDDAISGVTREVPAFDWILVDRSVRDPFPLPDLRSLRRVSQFAGARILLLTPKSTALPPETREELGIHARIFKPWLCSDLIRWIVQEDTPGGPASPGAGAKSSPAATAGLPRVLVVDDNKINRRLALLQLQRLNVEPIAAASGQEALEILGRERIPVLMMDCQMPGLDGFETARRIRADPARYGRPYIIAFTADASNDHEEQRRSAGMEDALTKPFRAADLKAVLGRASETLAERLGSFPWKDPSEG